jgi:hypothetical protein
MEQSAYLNIRAYGIQNVKMNIPTNVTESYFTESFSNNILNMLRVCDTKCPEYLEIELNPNIDRNNFKKVCHKVCFDMIIGGELILTIPLRFMMHLKDYEICDNKFYVSIPFQLFCDDIKLIFIRFQEVIFRLTNTENNFTSCNLISKGKLYCTMQGPIPAFQSKEHIIQYLASSELTSSNGIHEFSYNMPFDNIHKGFFIECENVDEINELKLQFSGLDRTIYNRYLVRTKCVKINQQLLYFPQNYDKSYTDRTTTGFEGSINLSRLNSSTLHIKLDNPQSKICIYGLGSNMIIYKDGMVGLISSMYSSHIYEEYKQTSTEPVSTPDILIYKPITDNDKRICCITHEEFSANARYTSCSQCNNNFDMASITTWFKSIIRKTCPMCRLNWTEQNLIYINGEDPKRQIKEPENLVVLDEDSIQNLIRIPEALI